MSHDVFLSHSSKDKTVADAICATLEREGIRCWVAPRDILPGRSWGESIVAAIENSRMMVIIFSAASNGSPQVMREVERAASKGLPIIPVRIQDVLPSKSLEFFLSVPHWLDALTPPLDAHLSRLAITVKTVLEASSSGDSRVGSGNASPPVGAKTDAPTSTAAHRPISASELRRISALRERSDAAWAEVSKSDDHVGFSDWMDAGRTLHAATSAAFEGARYADADKGAAELLDLCSRIHEAKGRRASALASREKVEAARRNALAMHADRLSVGRFAVAERFVRQAEHCLAIGESELASEHLREAEKELEAAGREAKAARIDEVKGFVADLATLLRRADPRDRSTRIAAAKLARERYLSNDQAKLLVGSAKDLAANPGAEPVMPETLAEVLGLATGLGPTLGQRLVLKQKTRVLWPLVVFCAWLLAPTTFLATGFASSPGDRVTIVLTGVVLYVATAGLLFIPVRVATRRPIAKRSLWITIVVAGGMMALLTTLALLAVADPFANLSEAEPVVTSTFRLILVLAWPLWTYVFWKVNRASDHFLAAERIYAWLIRGSILELLVAVPSHLLARRREECSAGAFSGTAIVYGVLLAFLACGPGLLLLYAQRIGRLRLPHAISVRRRRVWSKLWVVFGVEAMLGTLVVFMTGYDDSRGPQSTVLGVFYLVGVIGTVVLLRMEQDGQREAGASGIAVDEPPRESPQQPDS